MRIIDDILRDVFMPGSNFTTLNRKQLRAILERHLVPHEHVAGAEALIVYFYTEADREEFVQAVQEVKPDMRSIKL